MLVSFFKISVFSIYNFVFYNYLWHEMPFEKHEKFILTLV